MFDEHTREVDYTDKSVTGNYPFLYPIITILLCFGFFDSGLKLFRR